jgi:hypothetical protein
MKTAVRNLYETSVNDAWLAYDRAVGQVYQQYHDAFALGKVEREDGSAQVRNAGLVKCWEILMNSLDSLWLSYQKTGDGGSRMQSIFIRAWRSPGGFIPLTDDGRTLKAGIKTKSPHFMYGKVHELISPLGLYCGKFHNGYRVLAGADDMPALNNLFTLIPESETVASHDLNR